jgi:hypothetical protein
VNVALLADDKRFEAAMDDRKKQEYFLVVTARDPQCR